MDKRIVEFLNNNHIMALATACDNIPYCATCFYIFLKPHQMIVFISQQKTKHIQDALANINIAGTIFNQVKTINNIQGVQFCGAFKSLTGSLLKEARKEYYKKFPFAAMVDIPFWGIDLQLVKMTDNNLGFSKKIIWEAKEKNLVHE